MSGKKPKMDWIFSSKGLSFSLLAILLFLMFELCQCSISGQNWERGRISWWRLHCPHSLANDWGLKGHSRRYLECLVNVINNKWIDSWFNLSGLRCVASSTSISYQVNPRDNIDIGLCTKYTVFTPNLLGCTVGLCNFKSLKETMSDNRRKDITPLHYNLWSKKCPVPVL